MPDRHGIWTARLRLALALLLGVLIAVTGMLIGRNFGTRVTAPATTPPTTSTAASSAAPSPVNPPPGSAPSEFALLASDFDELANQLHATIGVAVNAVGSGQSPSALGKWENGPAWSTIKVPLAIAALREQDSSQPTDAMKAAITESDNAAAESIWAGLGDPVTAAHKVEAVLQQAGDDTVVEFRKIRPEFTAFGQTIWPLVEQARYLAFAACDDKSKPILDLMGQVEADQAWGLGEIPGTRFKGGWGPDPSGKYLVRQIGLVQTPNGLASIAIAAQPESGSFADGIQDLARIADWLTTHMGVLPAGRCGP